MEYDYIIKNGIVADFENRTFREKDIYVAGDRIAEGSSGDSGEKSDRCEVQICAAGVDRSACSLFFRRVTIWE